MDDNNKVHHKPNPAIQRMIGNGNIRGSRKGKGNQDINGNWTARLQAQPDTNSDDIVGNGNVDGDCEDEGETKIGGDWTYENVTEEDQKEVDKTEETVGNTSGEKVPDGTRFPGKGEKLGAEPVYAMSATATNTASGKLRA
ncbi:hypothetical protein VNI00_010850 [Paramarasmius palmivorus]|uniref:Uncharacterized protein n=1 Tax=Paramarasmius palmivorus TaxID=297713 RepID=A0AAW0CGZ5_9AGAR